MLPSPTAALGVRHARGSSRGAGAIAAAMAALFAAACTTKPGPTLSEAIPGLDARLAQPDGTLAAASTRDWKVPGAAWDGRAPLEATVAQRIALAENRSLRRVLVEVERRRALTRDAQLPPNPVVNVAGGIPVDMGVVPILAMVGQQLDWLWKREAIAGDADAQLESLLLEAAAVAVATAVEVRTAYVACAAAQEIELLTRRDAEVAGRVLLAAQAAFAEGEATASVVNEARMNAAEASNRTMESMVELVAAKTRLLEAIGRGDAGLAWDVASRGARAAREACAVAEPPVPEDDDALRRLVTDRRLDLRAAEARVTAAEARLALAVASRAPSVMVGAGWERDMEDDQAVMLQAQVTVPVFNDGRFRVQAAEQDAELARLDAEALRQRAVADARRALAAVDAASHHEAMLRGTTLASYESNKAILEAAVAEGDRPAISLWRSEHQENHIRIQLARAERDRTIAALGFERALAGGRLPSMGGSAPMAVPDAMGMGMGGLGPAQPLDFAAMETMQ